VTASRSAWRGDELTVLVVLDRNPKVRPRSNTSAAYCYLQSRNRLKNQRWNSRIAVCPPTEVIYEDLAKELGTTSFYFQVAAAPRDLACAGQTDQAAAQPAPSVRRGIAAAHTGLSTPVADMTLDTWHRRQVNPFLNKSLISHAQASTTPSHALAPRLLF